MTPKALIKVRRSGMPPSCGFSCPWREVGCFKGIIRGLLMLSFRTATVAAVILCVVLTGLSHPSSRVNDFFSNYYPAAEALVSSQDALLGAMERIEQ